MSDDYEVRFGTADEARGDYDHDLLRQAELDGKTLWNSKSATATIVKQLEESGVFDRQKTYRVIMVSREFYEFEVEAETEVLARIEAVKRMDNGDWGRPVEYAKTEIFDMEVVK